MSTDVSLSMRIKNHFLSEKRNGIIDVLRGLSIVMVIVSHFGLIAYAPHLAQHPIGGRTLIEIENGMGYYGVIVFFVISGFLITSLTLRRYTTLPQINFSEFWWFRFSRIMPMLGLCVVTIISFGLFHLPGFAIYSNSQLVKGVTSILSFRYNEIAGTTIPSVWSPLWSLSVEEMFYFAFPLVCLLLTGFGSIVWVFFTTFATILYLKYANQATAFSTLGCVDYLALGCLIAIIKPARLKNHLSDFSKTVLGWFIFVLGLAVIGFSVFKRAPFDTHIITLLCALGAALVIVSSEVLKLPSKSLYFLLPITLLGISSYEAYLLHLPLRDVLSLIGIHKISLQLLIIIIAALMLNFFFSEPMNQWLRHLHDDKKRNIAGFKKYASITLGLIACLILFPLSYKHMGSNPTVINVVIADVANLPSQTVEPIAVLGQRGAGDMVYLKHIDSHHICLGIDHWGSKPCVSDVIDIDSIMNKTLVIHFDTKRTEVDGLGRVLIANETPPYTRLGEIVIGVNNEGFSNALTLSASKFVTVP